MLKYETQQAVLAGLGIRRNSQEERQREILSEMFPTCGHAEDPPRMRCSLSLDLSEVDDFLSSQPITSFNFDIHTLTAKLGRRPLSNLICYLLRLTGLTEELELDVHKMRRFFRLVEDGYPDNPYHNRVHATDVLQRLHAIIHPLSMSPLDRLALYVTAACHDFGHCGFTNTYLVATRHILARRYHNRSPLENFHICASRELLFNPETRFVPAQTLPHLADLVTDLLLATDIANHVDTMRFPAETCGQNLWQSKLCLKCADIGHTAAPKNVHLKWSSALHDELAVQQKLEEQASLPLTLPAMEASNAKFFDFIVLPMYSKLASLFPHTKPLHEHACANRWLYG